MSLSEKKIKELYQEKKMLDEKSVPEFSNFMRQPGTINNVRRLRVFYLRVASIAVIAISAVLFFYYYDWPNKTGLPFQNISSVNANQPLPTQSLLNPGNGAAFIWNWKSPTDHLLHDARETMHLKK